MSQYPSINQDLPENVTLLVVSKGRSLEETLKVYNEGCRDFGENRLQDALPKIENAPKDIRWHFIGTLQKNKVAKIVGRFDLIHSVDSVDLARKISECSQNFQIQTEVLLQVNTSGEVTKHGFTPEDCRKSIKEIQSMPGIEVKGLMTMAPLIDDVAVVRNCFRKLRMLRDELGLKELSMGMSNDYKIALEEGATILRLGTLLYLFKLKN